MTELHQAGQRAKQILDSEGLAHVIYAISTNDGVTYIRDFAPEKFIDDASFEKRVKMYESLDNLGIIYAVHKR